MLNYLIYLIFSCLIVDYALSKMHRRKISYRDKLIYLGVLVVDIFVFTTLPSNFEFLIDILWRTIIITSMHGRYIGRTYELSAAKTIGYAVASMLIFFSSIFISNNFYTELLNYESVPKFSIFIVILLCSNFVNLLMWFVLSKLIIQYKTSFKIKIYWPIIIPIITILVILYSMTRDISKPSIYSLVFIIILANYAAIYIYIKNVGDFQIESERKKMELENNYYKEIAKTQMDHYDNSFSFIHDLIERVRNAEKAIDSGDQELSKNEIHAIHNDLIKEFNVIYTNSRTISTVINSHIKELTDNDIKLKTNITYSDFTFMDDSEAIKLFHF